MDDLPQPTITHTCFSGDFRCLCTIDAVATESTSIGYRDRDDTPYGSVTTIQFWHNPAPMISATTKISDAPDECMAGRTINIAVTAMQIVPNEKIFTLNQHCGYEFDGALSEIYRVLRPQRGRYFATTFFANYFRRTQQLFSRSNNNQRQIQEQTFQYFQSVKELRTLLMNAGFSNDKRKIDVVGPPYVIIRCER